MTNAQKLYQAAKASLGKDMVDDPGVDPSVGCADAVNSVYKLAFGNEIGGGASTAAMFATLLKDPRFKLAAGYQMGRIIISPTGMSTKGAPHGHVGICGMYGIMSNNSMSGLWQEYYTEQSWEAYYAEKLGFPTYYFEVI